MKRFSISRAARFFHLEAWFRFQALCVLTGVLAGLGAWAFDRALQWLDHCLLVNWLFDTSAPAYSHWWLLLVPAAGGGLAGALALWLAPEAAGHGTDPVIRAFHRQRGEIRARIPLIKGLCSILTIGTGGSAGKEGPIVQIGAGCGSTLAGLARLSVHDRRILMLAGVAGGIGAIFKAPLGGALFAAEFLYRDPDFEHDAVIPGVISSVTAYSVFTALDGYSRILQFRNAAGVELPPLSFPSPGGNSAAELLHYAILSLLCALVAFLFVKGLQWLDHGFFQRLPVPRAAKPALGGLLLGALAVTLMLSLRHVAVPPGQVLGASRPEHIMSGGYSYLQAVLNSALDPAAADCWVSLKLAGFLAVVVLAKILATAFTVGSGGSGGLLFPALFLGGVTGAAYAKLCRFLNDAGWLHAVLALPPNARGGLVLVGMGGVFAACTKTPIASLVMVSEITGSYGLVVPLMLACASAYLLSRSFTMHVEQVPGISDSPAHRGEFLVNVLEGIKVREAMMEWGKPEVFQADTPFQKVLERIKVSSATVFPIVDEKECIVGLFSLSDIRQIMNEQAVGRLVVAGDLGSTDVACVALDTNLDQALKLFTSKNLDALPVVEFSRDKKASMTGISTAIKPPRGPVGTMRVVGMLTRRDFISAYHRALHALQRAEEADKRASQLLVEVEPPGTAAEQALTQEPPPQDSTEIPEAGPDLLEEPPGKA